MYISGPLLDSKWCKAKQCRDGKREAATEKRKTKKKATSNKQSKHDTKRQAPSHEDKDRQDAKKVQKQGGHNPGCRGAVPASFATALDR